MGKIKKRQVIQHAERCKGCLYCSIACPEGAISVSSDVNGKGYNIMVVDHDKCSTCGTCYTVCPDYVFEIIEVNRDAA